MQPPYIDTQIALKFLFWILTLPILANLKIFWRIIQSCPNEISKYIQVNIPENLGSLYDLIENDQNRIKLELIFWHLKLRDFLGILSLFSGIILIGSYISFYFKFFSIPEKYIYILAGCNLMIIGLHYYQLKISSKKCVLFGDRQLASDIIKGLY